MEKLARYEGPIPHENFPALTVILCGLGVAFLGWFTVYEVTANKYTRSLPKELFIATLAAFFLGFGSLFLLLWVGIYV